MTDVNQCNASIEQCGRRRPVIPFAVWSALIAVLVLTLIGCVTETTVTTDGRKTAAAQPRSVTPAPDNAQATRMAFMVGSKPDDTTGDGYPDLIHASVTLFISERRPQAIRQDGTFEFTLYRRGEAGDPDAQPIAEWTYSGEDVRGAEAMSQYGPVYQFRLSLRDFPGHRRPMTMADLRCVFIPDDEHAPRVRSDGVRTIYIGRREGR